MSNYISHDTMIVIFFHSLIVIGSYAIINIKTVFTTHIHNRATLVNGAKGDRLRTNSSWVSLAHVSELHRYVKVWDHEFLRKSVIALQTQIYRASYEHLGNIIAIGSGMPSCLTCHSKLVRLKKTLPKHCKTGKDMVMLSRDCSNALLDYYTHEGAVTPSQLVLHAVSEAGICTRNRLRLSYVSSMDLLPL